MHLSAKNLILLYVTQSINNLIVNRLDSIMLLAELMYRKEKFFYGFEY